MRLIGMLDSPYVRRVAISLEMMQLPYSHEPVSVFRHYDTFAAINPVVKAPTLVTDTGTVLMDSSLILDYLERLVLPERRLTPADIEAYAQSQRIIGLALAAREKTVQIVYENNLRPAEKRHQPWLDRVTAQLTAAYRLLEASMPSGDTWLFGTAPLQADITTAVAWSFSQSMIADTLPAADYPTLTRFTSRAESLPAFRAVSPQ
jgi:glutathione S-transferase